MSLSFEWALEITPHLAIDPIIQVISLISRLFSSMKICKEQGTLVEVKVGLCPVVVILSSSCPLGMPPRTLARLCGNIFGVVVGDSRRVSFSPYGNIGISFWQLHWKNKALVLQLNFKVNTCRVKQASIKALRIHPCDSLFSLHRKHEKWLIVKEKLSLTFLIMTLIRLSNTVGKTG